jgi:plastocyanin
MRGMSIAVLCACGALVAGCSPGSSSSSGGGSSAAASSLQGVTSPHFTFGTSVKITDAGFRPLVLVTAPGEKVTWHNDSSSTQSVHFDNWGSPVDSGPLKPGDSWSFPFSSAGSLIYHSTFHPSFRGQVQIQVSG